MAAGRKATREDSRPLGLDAQEHVGLGLKLVNLRQWKEDFHELEVIKVVRVLVSWWQRGKRTGNETSPPASTQSQPQSAFTSLQPGLGEDVFQHKVVV